MMIMKSEFDIMDKAIKTGEKRKAKEIFDFIEQKEREAQGNFDASPYIIAELKNKLMREID